MTGIAAVLGVMGMMGGDPHVLQAQPALLGGAGRRAVTVGVAVEPELVFALGYQQRIGGNRAPTTAGGVRLGAGLMLPTTALTHGAWRADLRIATDQLGRGAWRVPVVAAGYLAQNRNTAGSMFGVGAELRAAPGRYGGRGGLGLDLGWQITAATYVRHTALLWAAGSAMFVRQKQGLLVAFDFAQVPLYAETGVRIAW